MTAVLEQQHCGSFENLMPNPDMDFVRSRHSTPAKLITSLIPEETQKKDNLRKRLVRRVSSKLKGFGKNVLVGNKVVVGALFAVVIRLLLVKQIMNLKNKKNIEPDVDETQDDSISLLSDASEWDVEESEFEPQRQGDGGLPSEEEMML